jgi:hypothetical protein
MIRFVPGQAQLKNVRSLDDFRTALARMTDYVQARDRDGLHLLLALDFHADDVRGGIDGQLLLERAAVVAKMIALGHAAEFTRSPVRGEEASDPGLYGDELEDLLCGLGSLAALARDRGEPVVVLHFRSQLLDD